jgi:hypothetical protein
MLSKLSTTDALVGAYRLQHWLKHHHKTCIALLLVAGGSGAFAFYAQQQQAARARRRPNKVQRLGLNEKFFTELRQLGRVMIPGPFSREAMLLLVHSLILISRTFLSIYVARMEGRIVKAIVQKDMVMFVRELFTWLLIALPATFVNSMIRYFESYIGLAFRGRLAKKAYEKYFQVCTPDYAGVTHTHTGTNILSCVEHGRTTGKRRSVSDRGH